MHLLAVLVLCSNFRFANRGVVCAAGALRGGVVCAARSAKTQSAAASGIAARMLQHPLQGNNALPPTRSLQGVRIALDDGLLPDGAELGARVRVTGSNQQGELGCHVGKHCRCAVL